MHKSLNLTQDMTLLYENTERPLCITPNRQSLMAGPALCLLPGLAVHNSIKYALMLQQVYHWTKKTCLTNASGQPVLRYTYRDWQKQFPFLTPRWIKNLLEKIEQDGWICIERGPSYNSYSMNQAELAEWEDKNIFGKRLLLASESPIKVFPSLVVAFGMVQAIVLQTIHIRTYKKPDWWVKKTTEEWHDELLPFVSVRSLERAISKLAKLGILDVEPVVNKGRRSKRVRVNYVELALALSAEIEMVPTKVQGQAVKTSQQHANTTQQSANSSAPPATSSPLT